MQQLVPLDQSIQVLVVAGMTFVVIQAAKRITPGLCGKHALALNVVLTAIGTVLAARPLTWSDAILLVLTGSGVAAGIHGTVRSFRAGQGCDAPADGSAPTSPSLAPVWLLAVLVGTMTLTGCAPRRVSAAQAPALPVGAVDQTDATANQVLQTAQGFASSVSAKVLSGQLRVTKAQQTALEGLNRAIDAAAPVEIAYHQCGIANPTDPAKTCAAPTVITAIASAQQAFAAAELALAPTAAK